MQYLLFLILPVLAAAKVTLQGVFSKERTQKMSDVLLLNGRIFTAIVIIMGALFVRAVPSWPTVLYGLGFGAFATVFQVAYTAAFRRGSVSMTAVINNFNIVIPVLFGVILFSDPFSVWKAVGSVLLVPAFILIPGKKGADGRNLSGFCRTACDRALCGGDTDFRISAASCSGCDRRERDDLSDTGNKVFKSREYARIYLSEKRRFAGSKTGGFHDRRTRYGKS